MSIVLQDLKHGSKLLVLALGAAMVGDVGHAQTVDRKAAAQAIMQADREFSRALAARDRKRFLSFISEDAVFFATGAMRGHGEILEGWAAFFEPGGATLTWEPTSAEVLVGGDVGVTIGSWQRRSRTSDGKTAEAKGQYATTWQKRKDGSWKAVSDIGSTAPGP
jgi:ketosteroid isomerase-like protein